LVYAAKINPSGDNGVSAAGLFLPFSPLATECGPKKNIEQHRESHLSYKHLTHLRPVFPFFEKERVPLRASTGKSALKL
jgi:hypothetical protein